MRGLRSLLFDNEYSISNKGSLHVEVLVIVFACFHFQIKRSYTAFCRKDQGRDTDSWSRKARRWKVTNNTTDMTAISQCHLFVAFSHIRKHFPSLCNSILPWPQIQDQQRVEAKHIDCQIRCKMFLYIFQDLAMGINCNITIMFILRT